MKSKVLKRAIAIMLCMVIVLNGAEYMRAGGSEGTDENAAETTQEEEIVLAEDQGEDVPDPEAPVAEEGKAAEKDEAANAAAGSGEEGKNPDQQEAAAGSGEEGKTPEQPEAGGKEEQPAQEPAAEKTEAEPELEPATELTWENEQVCITVSAETEDIIPRGARLSVTPIEKKEADDSMAAEEKAQVEEINAQYDATAEKLQEKAEGEDYDILGFLAYDIKFVDEEGHKTEPDGSVSVTMDYKEAAIPEEVKKAQEDGTEIADVTLMHLEEHSNGEVKDVIDMVADESQEASVQTTENTEVEKAEFATESFSTFTLVWKANDYNSDSIQINCVTTDGKEIRTNWEITFGDGTGTKIKTVEEVGSELVGYKFVKATLDKVSGTSVYRLRCEVKENKWNLITPYTYNWSYSTEKEGSSWKIIKNNTTIYFQYTDSLMDLDRKSISTTEYARLVENADKAQEGTLPITWTRSQKVIEEKSDRELSWDPGTMIANFGNEWYTDLTDVWDGSRSKDNGKTSKHNFIKYLPDNQITVKNGIMYDSASWEKKGKDNYYLFRGTFDLKALTLGENEQYGNYNFTIKSVVDEDKIYINDNMFVFVYPDDGTKIDKSNWQEYLAFWTGTVNENKVKNFNNSVPGRKATHGEATGFAKVTDGWYTGLVTDEAGNIIQHALSTGHGTKFRIDVIAHDNAEGGGMYRLKLEAKKDPSKVTFRFRKVDKDTNEGIEGTTFYLTPDTGDGASYYLTTNDEGYASAIVPTGTYTLRETKAHKYYQTTSNEWTVKVETGQVTMTAKTGNDGTATLGKNATTGWYITNTKRTDIKPALNAPQHNKTIYKNAKDDYTLSLDVKGAVGAADPIDVLLIVDESSSMNDTRQGNVNKAINTLKANLQASEAKDNIRLAAVGFSGNNSWGDTANNDAWAYTDTTGSAWRTVDAFSYTAQKRDGTNWQAGIKKGEELLKNRSEARINAATYVVFLTDGEPTFYYDKNGYTDGKGSKFDQDAYDKAVTEWTSSSYMYGATKYVVDATDSGNNTNCTNLANAVGATKKLSGANGTEMQNAFKAIADSITKPKYDKVVITDTLSEYVDFQDNPDVKVYADNTELTENVDYECTINKATKTITVNLLKGGALEKDVVYKVTFKVKPTELAYKTYAESGYKATGDEGTDTNPTNQITSSGQPGFRSNTTAKVSYKVNGLSDSAEYKHPVVQVDLDTTNWSVEKKWNGGPEESVQVRLTAKYDASNEKGYTGTSEEDKYKAVPDDNYYALTGKRDTQTLTESKTDASKNWAYKWENLPQHYYYTDTNGAIAKTKIQYSVTEVNPSEKYTVTYEDKTAESKTVITNTVKYRWQIVKVSTSTGPDGSVLTIPNAEFTLTDTKNSATTYTGTSGGDGVVTWTDNEGKAVERIPQGTYTLAETKAPNGYLLSDASWTVDTTGREPVVNAGTTAITVDKTIDAQGITTYSFRFENAPNYELPSTGGIGTYWYTIGGMLMMAAALVLYRKKKYTK